MWTKSALAQALQIQYPIVQGPFGGGNSTPALAAAVSNAGGLGSFGAVGLHPEQIRSKVAEIRALTSRAFNINLWCPIAGQDDVVPTDAARARMLESVAPLYRSLELAVPKREDMPTFDEQMPTILELRPPVFSFVMGVPDRAILAEARRCGIYTIGTATTVDEAVAIEDAGADAVVASGSDAGGHRGSFLAAVEDSLVGTMSLVPQIADAVRIPVIAAGGISNGRGIVAALALGADAVQIGSAFLATDEAGASRVHKDKLGTADARRTYLTRAITGRHARGIRNTLMQTLEEMLDEVLPYPSQHLLTASLRASAGRANRADLLALWAGQNAASVRKLPAADLLRLLVHEVDAALRHARLAPTT